MITAGISVHPQAVVSSGAVLREGVAVGPYAVVDANAVLGKGVTVGASAIVGSGVELGAGCRIMSHAVVTGPARFGERNVVHPFAVLGADPQDRSYAGQTTWLYAGDDNEFREHVTVHRGTMKASGVTAIGSGCLLMVGAHVAHDATIGDHVTLTNGTLVGGHAVLGNYVQTGGATAIAPFVRIGESVFLAAGAMVETDVPPFVIAAGDRASVRALNRVGLRRRGVDEASLSALKRAFRMLFRSGEPRVRALSVVKAELGQDPYVHKLIAFLEKSLAG